MNEDYLFGICKQVLRNNPIFYFFREYVLKFNKWKKYRLDLDIRFFIGFLFFKDFTDSLIVFYIDFHVKESPAQVESNVEKKN